ncbi:cation transporter [Thiolapillus sp.]
MSGCCDDNCSIDALRERQRGTLRIVLGINAIMFLVIIVAALYGNSTALLADSLDNLGDALTYGLINLAPIDTMFRASGRRQNKAQRAGKGCSLVKRCNAVLAPA